MVIAHRFLTPTFPFPTHPIPKLNVSDNLWFNCTVKRSLNGSSFLQAGLHLNQFKHEGVSLIKLSRDIVSFTIVLVSDFSVYRSHVGLKARLITHQFVEYLLVAGR